MRYFLDTEFDGVGGDLLSVALVREDGPSFYAVLSAHAKDEWVKTNVVPHLYNVPTPLKTHNIQGWYGDRQDRGFRYHMTVGEDLAEFLKGDPAPHIISDWPDDIRYFCQAIITGPGEMVAIPHLTFEVMRVDAYPTTLPGAVQHNAWWDAMALRHLLTPSALRASPAERPPQAQDDPSSETSNRTQDEVK